MEEDKINLIGMNNHNPIGHEFILNKINAAIECQDITQILCTKSRGIEGWIVGYYTEENVTYCEIIISKCTDQVEKLFNQYALILPSEINIIIIESKNNTLTNPIRYKDRIKMKD